jgi:hypothetical protein
MKDARDNKKTKGKDVGEDAVDETIQRGLDLEQDK